MRVKWIQAAIAVFVALFMAAPAAAQEAEAAAGHDQQMDPAMMQKWMEYSTPGEEHERLASHAGEWDYTMTWWMAPDAPPQESTGTMTAEMTMDGRYLIESWEGTAMGQPFKGRAISGYDNFNDEYFSTWIDNMGTGIMISRGSFDPGQNALVMTGTFDDFMTGEEDITMRGVSKMLDDNTLHMEMYMPGPDGQEFKSMQIHAVRQQ